MESQWIKCGLPYGPIYDENWIKTRKVVDSFTGRGLAKPGTLIKLRPYKSKQGNEVLYFEQEIYLIGHINPLRGVCDDCTEFKCESIVYEYKILEVI